MQTSGRAGSKMVARSIALLCLSLIVAGCVEPGARHVVYVESNGHDRLVFEIRRDGELVKTVTIEDKGFAPNVMRAYEREARQERTMSKTFTITETTLNLTRSIDVPTSAERHIIAEVYANNTMEVWALDHEPTFE